MKIAELKQICARPDVVEVCLLFLELRLNLCLAFGLRLLFFFVHLLYNFDIKIVQLLICFQVWDATAADPKLLVFLKSYRNTVPVPRHWCQKRKFLQVRDSL